MLVQHSGADAALLPNAIQGAIMAKPKLFHYAASFEEVQKYLSHLGYTLEPVYHYDTLQHYLVSNTKVRVNEDYVVKDPVTGDYLTAIHRSIGVGYQFDNDIGRRVYNEEDLKLYNRLYRRFRKKVRASKPGRR
jgi:hypothetical protein